MAGKDVVTELFLSSAKQLRHYIKRIVRSDETANDIVQEAFLRTFQHADTLETSRAFLFAVAKNLALDSRRHDNKLKFEHRDDLDELLLTDGLPEDLLIAWEQSEVLRKAIERLPPKCKEVFSQRVFFGLSYKQLAERFHISEKTAEHHIALGLRQTTQFMRKEKR